MSFYPKEFYSQFEVSANEAICPVCGKRHPVRIKGSGLAFSYHFPEGCCEDFQDEIARIFKDCEKRFLSNLFPPMR